MRLTLVKRWLVGPPMPLAQARHERLSKRIALAVFSSDVLSSVAYATEEILLVLVLAGSAATRLDIPISLAISFLFLNWTGETLNLMSLGGLAVAVVLIIDDTVVVIENIARHLSPGRSARGASCQA